MDAKSNEMQDLNELADRVTSLEVQIVQLRDEVRAGFSATHEEFAGVRQEFAGVRQEFGGVQQEFGGVQQEFAGVRQEFAAVREEMREGDEETRRLMRVLHEEVIARIKLIDRG